MTTYKMRGADLNLEHILAKLHKKPIKYTPVVYAASDVIAAKSVLDRLLKNQTRNEVSKIEVTSTQIQEP